MDESGHLGRIAAALVRRNVSFVVIGGWALEAQGFDMGYKTEDIDFTPDLGADNLDRLSAALDDLDAKVRAGGESLPFDHSGQSLGRSTVWNLTCRDGDFDLTFEPTGIDDYRALLASAHLVNIDVDGEQIGLLCADAADVIRSKTAADRPKDQAVLPLLRAQMDARRETDI